MNTRFTIGMKNSINHHPGLPPTLHSTNVFTNGMIAHQPGFAALRNTDQIPMSASRVSSSDGHSVTPVYVCDIDVVVFISVAFRWWAALPTSGGCGAERDPVDELLSVTLKSMAIVSPSVDHWLTLAAVVD